MLGFHSDCFITIEKLSFISPFEGQTGWGSGQAARGSEHLVCRRCPQPLAGGWNEMVFKGPSPPKPFYDSMILFPIWVLGRIPLPSTAIECSGSPVDWKSPCGISPSSFDLFLAAGALPALWEHCSQPGQAEPPSLCLHLSHCCHYLPLPWLWRVAGAPTHTAWTFSNHLVMTGKAEAPCSFWLCRWGVCFLYKPSCSGGCALALG